MTDQIPSPQPDSAALPAEPDVSPRAEPQTGTLMDPAAATPVDPQAAASYAKPSAPAPVTWSTPGEPDEAASSDGGGTSAAADRPEIAIGGAFAGGFLLAMILRRLAR